MKQSLHLKTFSKKYWIVFLVFFFSASMLRAQNAGINSDGSVPDASAMLDIKSSNKGLLIPRVSLTSLADLTTIPSPKISLLIFNTATAGSGVNAITPGFYFFNGSNWTPLAGAPGTINGWSLQGNAGTTGQQFLGTVDNKDLFFRINNRPVGHLGLNGNIFWGLSSGASNTTGFSNIAIGQDALRSNIRPSHNIAIGDSALQANGSLLEDESFAQNNVALGSKAAKENVIGSALVAIGSSALKNNIEGSRNTAVGGFSMFANVLGSNNTAVGNNALEGNTNGVNNVAVGASTMIANTTGNFNVAVGTNSRRHSTTGSFNSVYGSDALHGNVDGFSNVAIGASALHESITQSNIVAIGDSALFNNGKGFTGPFDGVRNVAVGSKAGFATTRARDLTAVGHSALFHNTTGNSNTGIGSSALFSNTAGNFNVALGDGALVENITGDNNIGIGAGAMPTNRAGSNNLAIGSNSLFLSFNTDQNTAIGAFSQDGATSGSGNTSIGALSLRTVTTGSNNTAVGKLADVNTAARNNATAIGANSRVDCNSCLVLGSVAGINGASSGVNVGIGTTNPTQALHVVGNIVATGSITAFSDIRFKTSIQTVSNVLPALMNINSIYYSWNKSRFPEQYFGDERQIGFSAQELEKFFPEIVSTDSKGFKSVDYSRLTPILLQGMKEQQHEIEALRKSVESSIRNIDALQKELQLIQAKTKKP